MATIKTEAVISGAIIAEKPGCVLCSFGHWAYDDEGGGAVDDVIQMCPVPDNARIIDILVEWPNTFAAGCTFDVGDGDDDDRFLAAISNTANAGRMSLFGGLFNSIEIDEAINANGVGYTYTDPDTIDIVTEGAASATGDLFVMCVLYMVEGFFADE